MSFSSSSAISFLIAIASLLREVWPDHTKIWTVPVIFLSAQLEACNKLFVKGVIVYSCGNPYNSPKHEEAYDTASSEKQHFSPSREIVRDLAKRCRHSEPGDIEGNRTQSPTKGDRSNSIWATAAIHDGPNH